MYKKILVPVVLDHEPNISSAMDAAHKLLESGGQILLLHVMEDVPGYIVGQLPSGILESNRNETESKLKAIANNVGAHVKSEVVSGNASRSILDYAEEKEADCIVIASHRPGLQDYLLGSTAARVVRHAGCSVLVIR